MPELGQPCFVVVLVVARAPAPAGEAGVVFKGCTAHMGEYCRGCGAPLPPGLTQISAAR